jgi:hypothetical protein
VTGVIDIADARGASFSPCRRWRYDLWRVWDRGKPTIAFVALNPSTADEKKNDPTIRRCLRFAREWGYGTMHMLNAFGYRATDPRDMKAADDPVGPGNDEAILDTASRADFVVVAWGVHGTHRQRDEQLRELLEDVDLWCLGLTKEGQPRHPLFMRASTQPLPYR